MFFNRQVEILRSADGQYDEDGVWQEGTQQVLKRGCECTTLERKRNGTIHRGVGRW